ncbi:predicted protein [Aspergillus terreus NIH2624]|uniref:F-box domain-containing protein n=1 Tax=Aspergillus terreus (strain NIH 2624 / FGSC A1156) TaxID=341663 RepID=Q0CDK5_ASPTN|nr:uncharacterized protein ATEG_08229 [Aspergillus terreus NIH2624]EAU31402.1 predicted protein [Aspergillus terreus NIH2624]
MAPDDHKSFFEILPNEIWQRIVGLFSRLQQNVGQGVYPHVPVLILSYAGYTSNGRSMPELRVDPALIYGLVAKLRNLEIIRWTRHAFPPLLFRDLNIRQPAPELFIDGAPCDLVGAGLEDAACIKSLSMTYGNRPSEPDINALGKVISSLPNLERLILKHHPGRRHGVSPIFDLLLGSMLPPLRILSLANFSFTSEQAVGWARCLKGQSLRGLSLDGTSQLSELICHLGGCVANLQSLEIRISDGTAASTGPQMMELLDQFLQQITKLRAFSAYDVPKEVLHHAVHHHGNHLRRLRFRRTRCSFLERPGRSELGWRPEI